MKTSNEPQNNELTKTYGEFSSLPTLEHIENELCEYIGGDTVLRLEATTLYTTLCFEVDGFDINAIIDSEGDIRVVDSIDTPKILARKFDKIQAVANFWIRLKDYSFKGSSRDAFEAVRRTLMEVSDEDINKLKEASTILRDYFSCIDSIK